MVSKDFSYTLLDPKDLRDFTGLSTSTIVQKQTIPLGVDWSVVRWHLEGMYGEVEDGKDEEGRDCLTVSLRVELRAFRLTFLGDERSAALPGIDHSGGIALVERYE